MAIEKEIILTVDASKAEKSVKDLDNTVNETIDSTEDLGSKSSESLGLIDNLTGGVITKMKGFKNSLIGVSKGFKSVGTAIALSGIGLLAIVIASVVTAFKSSEEGQNKFAKIMGVIGAVTGNVMDLIADLGELVIDLFSGDSKAFNKVKSFGKGLWDFIGLPLKNINTIGKTVIKTLSGFWNDGISGGLKNLNEGISELKGNFTDASDVINKTGKSLSDFAKQNIREAKLASKVADDRARADKLERSLLVERATLENDIAHLRLKARQENSVSAKERKEALEEAQRLEDRLLKKETEVLKLRSDAITLENTFSRSTKENLDSEAQAKAELIKQEARRTNAARQTQRELTRVENELASDAKARAKEIENKQKEIDKIKSEKDKELADKEKERLKSLYEYRNNLIKQQEDYEDKTEEEKLKRARSRAQEELDNLITNETEKKEAQLLLDDYYNNLELEMFLEKERRKKEYEDNRDIQQKEFEAEKEEDEILRLEKKQELILLEQEMALADLEFKRNIYKEGTQARLDAEQEYLDKKQELDQNQKTNEVKTSKETEKREENLKNFKLDLASNLAGSLQGLAEEGSAFAKGLAITQAGISTYQGINKALAETTDFTPTQTLRFANAAAVGIAGFANVANILKQGGSSDGSSNSTPTVEAPSFNIVEGTAENQISESIQAKNNEPVQAFVVSKAVTSNQELDRNIESKATL